MTFSQLMLNIADAYWLDNVRAQNKLDAKQGEYDQRQGNISDLLGGGQSSLPELNVPVYDQPDIQQPEQYGQPAQEEARSPYQIPLKSNGMQTAMDYANINNDRTAIPRKSGLSGMDPYQIAEINMRANEGPAALNNLNNITTSMRNNDVNNLYSMEKERFKINNPAPSSAMKEYGMYQSQGGQDTLNEYMKGLKRAGASNTKVSVGTNPYYKLSPGYMLKNPNNPLEGMIPVPGGPEALETQGDQVNTRVSKTDQAKINTMERELHSSLRDYETALKSWENDKTNLDKMQYAESMKKTLDLSIANRVNWQGEPGEPTIQAARETVSSPISAKQLLMPGNAAQSGINALRDTYDLSRFDTKKDKEEEQKTRINPETGKIQVWVEE